MSNEKANISKVKKQKLLSGEETKTVFPVTIDEAVKVKRGDDKYTTLTNALKSKISGGLVIAVKDANDNYVYYMFTFSTNHSIMKNSETDRVHLRNALLCSNKEFIELCAAHNDDLDYVNIGSTPMTEKSLQERIQSKYVKSLFLSVIPLHPAGVPKVYVIDEQGNQYTSGDTIYFARYPGRLWVLAENLDLNYTKYLTDLIYTDNTYHAIQFLSGEPSETDTELTFYSPIPGVPSDGSMFSNPYMFPSDFEEANVNMLNAAIKTLLEGGILVEIAPIDYPWGDSVAIDSYKTKTVQGKMYVDDLIYLNYYDENRETRPTPFGLESCWFNIIFAPTPDFVMQEPGIAAIWKQTDWTGEFVIKGVNAAAADTITLNITDDTYEYLFKRKEDSDYTTFDNIQLTGEEVSSQKGVTLQVRPVDYREDEYYVPFELEEATLYNTTVGILYNGVQKEITQITLDVREEDFKKPFIVVEDTLQEDGEFYQLLHVTDPDCTELILHSYFIVDGYTPALYYIAVNEDEEDIATILNRIETEELSYSQVDLRADVFSAGRRIPITDSHKVLVKITMTPQQSVQNKPKLEFYFQIRQTISGGEIFYIEYKEGEDPGTSQYEPISFEGDINNTAALKATNKDNSIAISRLLDNGFNTSSTTITVRDLKHITSLRNGIFSGLDGLTDASFMQYMTRITEIPKCAFYGCTSLERVIIPEGVTSIGDEAFAGCASLTEIVIPNSVTRIGRRAFIGCTGLTKIDFGAGVMTLGGIGLTESDNLNTIILRGIEPIPDTNPVAMRGVNLEAMMGLHISNRICFSLAIQGEGSSNVTFYVPEGLLDGYPEMNWGQFFPNATWEDLDNLPTEE